MSVLLSVRKKIRTSDLLRYTNKQLMNINEHDYVQKSDPSQLPDFIAPFPRYEICNVNTDEGCRK